MIAQPTGITVERSVWKTDGWFQTAVDNPAIGRTGLALANVGIAPNTYPQQVEAVIAGNVQNITYRNSNFWFAANAEGSEQTNGLSLWGSVDETNNYPYLDTFNGDPLPLFWSAPSTMGRPLVSRGVRVGWKNWNGRLRSTLRSGNTTFASPGFKVRLDPQVALVPIQVAVMVSPSNRVTNINGSPGEMFAARLRNQLAFWDQYEVPETSHIWSVLSDGGAEFDRTNTSKQLWMRKNSRGLYTFNGFAGGSYTPDSAWSWVGEQGGPACKVQFRLVNYYEVEVDDRQVDPKRNASGNEPESGSHYLQGTIDDRPCRDNELATRVHPSFMPGVPRVIFMKRAGFYDSPEQGRALFGEDTACVTGSLSVGPNMIAHELGHMAGLNDGGCGTSSQMMCTDDGGDPYPNQTQCDAVRNWGLSIEANLRNLGGGAWAGFARP